GAGNGTEFPAPAEGITLVWPAGATVGGANFFASLPFGFNPPAVEPTIDASITACISRESPSRGSDCSVLATLTGCMIEPDDKGAFSNSFSAAGFVTGAVLRSVRIAAKSENLPCPLVGAFKRTTPANRAAAARAAGTAHRQAVLGLRSPVVLDRISAFRAAGGSNCSLSRAACARRSESTPIA